MAERVISHVHWNLQQLCCSFFADRPAGSVLQWLCHQTFRLSVIKRHAGTINLHSLRKHACKCLSAQQTLVQAAEVSASATGQILCQPAYAANSSLLPGWGIALFTFSDLTG